MFDTERPLGYSRFHNRNHRSAILLAWASGTLIAGACAGVLKFGAEIQAPLGMVLIAIILSIAAVALSAREECSVDPVQSGTRRLWLIFAALLLIHGWLAFLCCKAMPAETIDTFTIQRDVCQSLVQGIDPYSTTHANIFDSSNTALFYGPGMVVNGRVQVGFQYPR
jgi:hypothetical protein